MTTKLEMSRIIVQALYNLSELPSTDDSEVVKISKKKIDHLEKNYVRACKILKLQ